MLNRTTRLAAFAALGHHLASLTEAEITDLAYRARNQNAWFDLPNVRTALAGIVHLLAEPALSHWAGRYPAEPATPRQVGVVMAGNIPMVGFSRRAVRAAQRPHAAGQAQQRRHTADAVAGPAAVRD